MSGLKPEMWLMGFVYSTPASTCVLAHFTYDPRNGEWDGPVLTGPSPCPYLEPFLQKPLYHLAFYLFAYTRYHHSGLTK